MKNKTILALGCMFLFVSCNSGLTKGKAKEIFKEHHYSMESVNVVSIIKKDKSRYIVKIQYTPLNDRTRETEYIYTKLEDGWAMDYKQ